MAVKLLDMTQRRAFRSGESFARPIIIFDLEEYRRAQPHLYLSNSPARITADKLRSSDQLRFPAKLNARPDQQHLCWLAFQNPELSNRPILRRSRSAQLSAGQDPARLTTPGLPMRDSYRTAEVAEARQVVHRSNILLGRHRNIRPDVTHRFRYPANSSFFRLTAGIHLAPVCATPLHPACGSLRAPT